MIDAIRVNIVRGSRAWKSVKVKVLSNYTLVKGKCVLVLVLITLLIIVALLCINFDGFLLRMSSLF
jgi:hypothetical protein